MVKLRNTLNSLPDSTILTSVAVAIPCYNTELHIARVVTETKKYVEKVIVIDDGSTDLTAKIAKNSGAIVVSHGKNKGYGEAIMSCLKSARDEKMDVLVIIDGDGQHNPDEIPSLLSPVITDNVDLVIGSRFLSREKKIPGYRKLGINVINFLWNFGSKVKVTDTQSGFRAYNKKIIYDLSFHQRGMGISIEILEKARKLNLKIEEVPITCSYENNNSSMSQKAMKHGIGLVFSVFFIRIQNLFNKE